MTSLDHQLTGNSLFCGMMIRVLFLMGIWLTAATLSAQYQQQILFPGLESDDLIDQLVEEFKTDSVMSYSNARDTLFSKVYGHDDSLTCVYSGHTVYMDPDEDPNQTVFMNGHNDGINTEHTWPQSLGASDGPPRSDMHHLYPTRIAVNSARGSKAFGEIQDTQTDRWFYQNQELTSIPNQHIDRYSEETVDRFEPREDHKGNVARAMFYFYTIYRAEANAGSASYFDTQREQLCAWHLADPVDSLEWHRTQLIAQYQGGYANPFVLDCTLPQRSYCADQQEECDFVISATAIDKTGGQLGQNFPNPFSNSTTIPFELQETAHVQLLVFNQLGQLVDILIDRNLAAGAHTVDWRRPPGPGLYYCQLQLWSGDLYSQWQQSMLVIPAR